MIHALHAASPADQTLLHELMKQNPPDKVPQVLQIFQRTGINQWALELKNQFLEKALHHLDEIAVLSKRKEPLRELAGFLVQREY